MNAYQLATPVGIPITVLVVFANLAIAARPDRDPDGNGVYALYLGLASP